MAIWLGVLGILFVACIGMFKINVGDVDFSMSLRHIFERPWPTIGFLVVILITALNLVVKYVRQRSIDKKIAKKIEEFKTKQHKVLVRNAAKKLAKKLQAGNQGYAEANSLLKMVAIGLACCLNFVDDISPILKRQLSNYEVKISYIDENDEFRRNWVEGAKLSITWPLKTTVASRKIKIW